MAPTHTSNFAPPDFGPLFPEGTDLTTYRFADLWGPEQAPPEKACDTLCCLAGWWNEERRTGASARDWLAVQTILDQALTQHPGCDNALLLKGRIARQLAECSGEEQESKALLTESVQALRQVLDPNPRHPKAWLELGMTLYSSSENLVAEAEQAFMQVLTLTPEDAWARLFLAHCLHDQKRWEAALLEYLRVDIGPISQGPAAWRAPKLKEQIAFCALKLGLRSIAAGLFEDLLDRYEKLPNADAFYRADLVFPDELVQAASAELAEAFGARTQKLIARMGWSDIYARYLEGRE